MKYLCQLDYPDMRYPTNMGTDDPSPNSTIKTAGCGLCSACMVAELLTDKTFTLEEAEALSEQVEANHRRGTDMLRFAPAFAERMGLTWVKTNELSEAIAHLQKGGKIITHVGIPEGASTGLFTKGGHYMVLMDTDGENFTILDPSYKIDKFDIPERYGRVDTSHAPFLRCPVETLHSETKPGKIKYHLFARKMD